MRDIFRDFAKDELVDLLNDNKKLRGEFNKFIGETLKHSERENETLDLIGPKNLSIVEENGRYKLLVLDPHWIHHTDVGGDDAVEKTNWRLAYLKQILEIIKTI